MVYGIHVMDYIYIGKGMGYRIGYGLYLSGLYGVHWGMGHGLCYLVYVWGYVTFVYFLTFCPVYVSVTFVLGKEVAMWRP